MAGSQQAKKQEELAELPGSDDKKFWGEDAEIRLIDTSKPEEIFRPREGHRWVQQGPFLVCKSCPLTHSVYIGIDKQLVGFDKKGRPRIVSRTAGRKS